MPTAGFELWISRDEAACSAAWLLDLEATTFFTFSKFRWLLIFVCSDCLSLLERGTWSDYENGSTFDKGGCFFESIRVEILTWIGYFCCCWHGCITVDTGHSFDTCDSFDTGDQFETFDSFDATLRHFVNRQLVNRLLVNRQLVNSMYRASVRQLVNKIVS